MHLFRKIFQCTHNTFRLYSNKNILQLRDRGLIREVFPANQSKEITDLLGRAPQCVYAGFDPTASSLHVGNLLVIIKLLQWQRSGNNVIALIGGATGRIGDPSGRTSERPKLNDVFIDDNLKGIRQNILKIFDNHDKLFWHKHDTHPLNPVTIINNEEFYRSMDVIEFISSIGRNFRLGTMLLKQSVQERLKSDIGMSFTEFSYQIFQAADWLFLYRKHNCRFQVGGSDQMGNILAGHDLISRLESKPVYGMTLPLITSEEGDKFGKSAGNAIWLDDTKTSALSFYQFFLRTKDSEIEKLLKYFTFLTLPQIKQIMIAHETSPEKRSAQKTLAENLTLLVHGKKGLKRAELATEVLYTRSIESLLKLSSLELTEVFQGSPIIPLLLSSEMRVLDLAMQSNCFPTTGDAVRIIKAGGFSINHQKVTNFEEILTESAHILPNKLSLLRVGKKNYYIVKWQI